MFALAVLDNSVARRNLSAMKTVVSYYYLELVSGERR